MPSPFRTGVCLICGHEWHTRSLKALTCSPKCRAALRERRRPTSGRPARTYPPDLVAQIQRLYESGLTIAEVSDRVGPGCKVQLVMERYGIERRGRYKRNQRGVRNHGWRGDVAGYQALHLRVASARGKPMQCEWCGSTEERRYEWANLTGDYGDVNDYARLCVSCHRRYDAARRKATGKRTSSLRGGGANV